MNAICLVIDRLHAGYLGCYGNSWVGTPGFDRLAAESFVLDGAYIDSPELESLYRSYWLGSHALTRIGHGDGDAGQVVNPSAALPQALAGTGISTILVTDAQEVSHHPLSAVFGHREEVPTHVPRRAAAVLEETQTARFFAAASDALREAKPPFLLWLHSQGMAGPWDAPRELRERYAAEGDPAPPEFVRSPAMRLPADPDPDELLGIRQAYAAQVAVVDSCVQVLDDALHESARADDTLLVLLSARGFPLGAHGIVGQPRSLPDGSEADVASGQAESLYSELTSIGWLLRLPKGLGAADRSAAFAQPADLYGTLIDWFQRASLAPREAGQAFLPARQTGMSASHQTAPSASTGQRAAQVGRTGHSLLPLVRGDALGVRDRAAMVSPLGELALRTPAWYARFESAHSPELYVKPDDRWEINDVARRCPEVTEAMRMALSEFEVACQGENASGAAPLPALNDLLVDGRR